MSLNGSALLYFSYEILCKLNVVELTHFIGHKHHPLSRLHIRTFPLITLLNCATALFLGCLHSFLEHLN